MHRRTARTAGMDDEWPAAVGRDYLRICLQAEAHAHPEPAVRRRKGGLDLGLEPSAGDARCKRVQGPDNCVQRLEGTGLEHQQAHRPQR